MLALLFYDFCYYWLHRAGHEVAVFWAAHVVHHQSQQYNLSTALRQTSSGALLGWVFYLPMAVAGVPPLIFGIVALIDLLYQFWVHTELVRKLGWFDRVFCSPSNHRVHHAVNDRYLDKNYGGILILWDRLFGSFREEDEPCVYGTRGDLRSWDPLWANAEVYWQLLQDSWRARNWADKLRVWFKPPGWRPADVAAALAQTGLRSGAGRSSSIRRWHVPSQRYVGAGFVMLLAGVAAGAVVRPRARAAATWRSGARRWSLTFWSLGAVLQSRLSVLGASIVQAAVLATASATLGLQDLHYLFKPLTMVLAVALVLRGGASPPGPAREPRRLLAAALVASLAGDVFLMLPVNAFIPGLASFLVAHLFYIALFRRAQAWFPSRAALLGTLAFRRRHAGLAVAGPGRSRAQGRRQRLCARHLPDGGAGDRPGHRAARPLLGARRAGRLRVHGQRRADRGQPLRPACATGQPVDPVAVLPGTDPDRVQHHDRRWRSHSDRQTLT